MHEPKIGLILQTWRPQTKPFVDACIASIRNLDYQNYEVILVQPKHYPYSFPVKTLVPPQDHYWGPEGHQMGVDEACRIWPDIEHIALVNDDTILTKESLKRLVAKTLDQPTVVQPISNDGGPPSKFPFQQYREEMLIHQDRMMNMDSPFVDYSPQILPLEFACMFFTLIPRVIYEAVGGIDINYHSGQDDIDMCLRIRIAGYPIVLALDSLVWHASGVSADSTVDYKTRKENIVYFKNKWGKYPPGMNDETIKNLDLLAEAKAKRAAQRRINVESW